jgi:ribonuclease P protein component
MFRQTAQRVKRRFRLTSTRDFLRVRRLGKSYAHPLLVLVALPNELGTSRFAVSAGRSVGNAVQRNRAKRLIRESVRPLIPRIKPGWDLLFLARQSLGEAEFLQAQKALIQLLQRSHLVDNSNVC